MGWRCLAPLWCLKLSKYYCKFVLHLFDIECLSITSFRFAPIPHHLLCWPLWRYQWNYECHCEMDTKWWRQCWYLPHENYHQRFPDPVWRTSEHHRCQFQTIQTDWFYHRQRVQHYITWCQLWKSGGGWKWAPDNYSSRYMYTQLEHCMFTFRLDVEETVGHVLASVIVSINQDWNLFCRPDWSTNRTLCCKATYRYLQQSLKKQSFVYKLLVNFVHYQCSQVG